MILPMNLVEDVPHEAREVNIITTVGEVPKAAALYDGSRSEMLLGLCCGQRSIASIYVLLIRGVSQSRGLTRDRKGTAIFNVPSQNWTLQMLPL